MNVLFYCRCGFMCNKIKHAIALQEPARMLQRLFYFVISRTELRDRDWSNVSHVMCKNKQCCPVASCCPVKNDIMLPGRQRCNHSCNKINVAVKRNIYYISLHMKLLCNENANKQTMLILSPVISGNNHTPQQ